jgi:hypothetical protein
MAGDNAMRTTHRTPIADTFARLGFAIDLIDRLNSEQERGKPDMAMPAQEALA